MSYVIITPVRNEGAHFHQTLESVLAQTLRPLAWVIVDDGSTDITPQLVDAVAAQHPWIHAVHRTDRGFRQQGSGVIEAFYDGYAKLATLGSNSAPSLPSEGRGVRGEGSSSSAAWSFLVKLDGDLSFASDYFEQCFSRFVADPKLGIAGGRVYCRRNGATVEDSPGDPSFHVRGATKIYRRECWDQLGGLVRAPGWDTLDEVKANMLGWKTCSFPDLRLLQLKPTGSADGSWRNWVKNGRANYTSGYHPLFMLLKCLKRTVEKPYGIAALGLFTGFCAGYLRRLPQVPDPGLIRYLRRQQMNRLLGKRSLWSSPSLQHSNTPSRRASITPAPHSANG
ncbi:MAG TPA: glycosyltransferase family A protein [Verrucomicrobiae bacterium]|nr:glycosyltransferase family A protein [Verrucomicrobiae bacterium]